MYSTIYAPDTARCTTPPAIATTLSSFLLAQCLCRENVGERTRHSALHSATPRLLSPPFEGRSIVADSHLLVCGFVCVRARARACVSVFVCVTLFVCYVGNTHNVVTHTHYLPPHTCTHTHTHILYVRRSCFLVFGLALLVFPPYHTFTHTQTHTRYTHTHLVRQTLMCFWCGLTLRVLLPLASLQLPACITLLWLIFFCLAL